jgi:hypothetical protein
VLDLAAARSGCFAWLESSLFGGFDSGIMTTLKIADKSRNVLNRSFLTTSYE